MDTTRPDGAAQQHDKAPSASAQAGSSNSAPPNTSPTPKPLTRAGKRRWMMHDDSDLSPLLEDAVYHTLQVDASAGLKSAERTKLNKACHEE